MPRKFFVVLGICAAVLFGCWLLTPVIWKTLYPSFSWRYKIIVEVQTPEGIKTGTAVREVTVQMAPQLSPHMKSATRIKGEAVAVDLGERGILFALLKGYRSNDHAKFLPFYIFPSKAPLEKDRLSFYSSLKAGPKEVESQFYPMLVYFRDLKDPKTVEYLIEMRPCLRRQAWPESVCVHADHFEKVFGKGVSLKAITVEMTDEKVEMGRLDSLLPWMPEKAMGASTGPIKGNWLLGKDFLRRE